MSLPLLGSSRGSTFLSSWNWDYVGVASSVPSGHSVTSQPHFDALTLLLVHSVVYAIYHFPDLVAVQRSPPLGCGNYVAIASPTPSGHSTYFTSGFAVTSKLPHLDVLTSQSLRLLVHRFVVR